MLVKDKIDKLLLFHKGEDPKAPFCNRVFIKKGVLSFNYHPYSMKLDQMWAPVPNK